MSGARALALLALVAQAALTAPAGRADPLNSNDLATRDPAPLFAGRTPDLAPLFAGRTPDLAPPFAGRTPDPGLIDRLAATLTPPLQSVLRPLPPLPSADMVHKLAWMATLGHRLDARDGHSKRRAWRKIMHWPEPGDTLLTFDRAAPDESLERYPVPGGRSDPGIDFAASLALGWLDPLNFSCDFPLRARYLADHDLIPRPTRFEAGKCQKFERWADLARVEAVEVVYVTPSWSDASASMGHVIFRIRHAGSERVTGQSFEPVFAYTAIEPPDTTEWYIFKGLTGGLTTRIRVERMGDVYRRYGIAEARDLVLYELKLSRLELRYLLAEVFAQDKQKASIPYAFLSVNCASLAYDLVQSIVPELPDRSTSLPHPHEVVSKLLEAGRATPKAVLPSRFTRAAVAEGRLEALMAAMGEHLAAIPGLAELHAVRTGGVDERHAALTALDATTQERALDPAQADALATYIDALIDIETWAIDRRLGKVDPNATSPVLDVALDVRARLPMHPDERFFPLPRRPLLPSGSRLGELQIGMSGERPLFRLELAVIEERTGEPRAVVLRRAGRMTVMRSETAVVLDGDTAHLDEQRVVIFDSGTFTYGPVTELGWWRSRMGFQFSAETLSRPRDDLDFAMRVRGGLNVTLAASDDFADHLVIGGSIEGSTWSNGLADLRAGAGLFIEAGLALGDQRLRVDVRALPGWAFPSGFGWAFEATLGLDLVLDRELGMMLRPAFSMRKDMPIPDAWELVMGLSW